jgi:hypothetical protein
MLTACKEGVQSLLVQCIPRQCQPHPRDAFPVCCQQVLTVQASHIFVLRQS